MNIIIYIVFVTSIQSISSRSVLPLSENEDVVSFWPKFEESSRFNHFDCTHPSVARSWLCQTKLSFGKDVLKQTDDNTNMFKVYIGNYHPFDPVIPEDPVFPSIKTEVPEKPTGSKKPRPDPKLKFTNIIEQPWFWVIIVSTILTISGVIIICLIDNSQDKPYDVEIVTLMADAFKYEDIKDGPPSYAKVMKDMPTFPKAGYINPNYTNP